MTVEKRELQLSEARLWTRAEYDRVAEMGLFDGERLELLEGRIVRKMTHGTPHFTAILLVEEALRATFRGGYVVRVQGPLALGDYNEPEPDVAVVRGSIRDSRLQHPSSAVLVVEVADSSLTIDLSTMAGLYARAGIPEYWILNLVDGVLEVQRDPVAQPEQPLGFHYRTHQRLTAGQSISPLELPASKLAVANLLP